MPWSIKYWKLKLLDMAHDKAKKCQLWPTCVACTRDPRKRVSWEKTQRDQRHQRDPVTRVPMWPMLLKSQLGHKRDPILWPCDPCFQWEKKHNVTTWPCVPESNFPPKIHNVTNVTSVTLWPVYQCDRCYWRHNWVTNVTQFCDPVSRNQIFLQKYTT